MAMALRVRLPSGKTQTLTVDTSITSAALLALLEGGLSLDHVTILAGFPPVALPSVCVLSEHGVRSGDTLTLRVAQFIATQPSPIAVAASTDPGRPGRAAKENAATYIKDAVREELLQKKQRSPSTAGTAASKGAIAGVKRPRPAANSWGPGRTLHDEGPVASLNPTAAAPARASGAADTKVKRGTGPRRRALVLRSREDVEAGLLRAAARGGGGQGGESAALSEFFKAASCIALRQQYDVSRATGRLAAALAGAYSLRPLSDGRSLRAGTPMQLEVRFSPRAAASSAAAAASSSAAAASFAVEVEVVDNLPAEALVAVLRGVLESAAAAAASGAGAGEEGGGAVLELLKPHMLAQVSPRQFWGVVRWGGLLLVRRQGPEGPPSFDLSAETPWGRPVDPAAALAALVPSADWAFLARRPRRPTEKALAAAAEAAARGGGGTHKARAGGAPPQEAQAAAAPDPAPAAADARVAAAAAAGPSLLLLDTLRICGGAATQGAGGAAALEASCRATTRLLLLLALPEGGQQQAGGDGEGGPGASLRLLRGALARLCAPSPGLPRAAAPVSPAGPPGTAPAALLAALRSAGAEGLLPPDPPAGEEGADDEEEEEAFVCGACGKTRLVCARRDGLDPRAIEADEGWACTSATGSGSGGGGFARLRARGGCEAPDDEVAAALGSDAGAAACEALGLTSLEAVASALVPEDEEGCLYAGPEGPVDAAWVEEGGLGEVQSALQRGAEEGALPEAFARLAQRVPPLAALTGPEPPPPEARACCSAVYGDAYARDLVPYRLRGYRLALAAALVLARGAPGPAQAPLLLHQYGDVAAALLRTPLGWAAAALLARHWQGYARFEVMSLLMAEVTSASPAAVEEKGEEVQGGGASGARSAAVLASLEAACIMTPQDLLSLPAGLIAALFQQQQAGRGAAAVAEMQGVSLADVEAWQAAARRLVHARPWLREVTSK